MTASEPEYGTPLLEAALQYAEWGLPVLPLKPDGKEAILSDWPNQATTDSDKIREWRAKTPRANVGILTGERSGLVVIDSDEKNDVSGRKSIREAGLNMPDTWVVHTPNGGLHYYYQYPAGQEIRSRSGVLNGVDIRGAKGYAVAPPSLLNGKPYESADKVELAPLPLEWVGLLTKSRDQPAHSEATPILEGGRNDTLTRLAGSMRYKGFSPSSIEAALIVVNSEHCNPPLDQKEVATIAQSVGKYPVGDYSLLVDFSKFTPPPIKADGNPSPASSPKYDIRRYDGVEPLPPDGQIKDLIELNTLVEYFGGWGTGKTFLILDQLACIASSEDYHGRAVAQGPVVYFCGEGQRGLSRRLRAWENEYGINLVEHPFYICTTPAALCEGGDAQAVIAAILATGEIPVHVCFDTRSRNFGAGDENSPKDMDAFLKSFDIIKNKFGCTVSAVHHPGHMEKGRSRGHSSWQGALDVSYQISKTPCGIVAVEVAKAPKDFEPPEPFAFQLTPVELGMVDEDGKPVTSCVLRPIGAPAAPRKQPQGAAQKEMLEILKRLTSSPEEASPVSLGLVPASDWKAACIEAGRSENTFYSARKKLIEKKLILEVGDSIRLID